MPAESSGTSVAAPLTADTPFILIVAAGSETVAVITTDFINADTVIREPSQSGGAISTVSPESPEFELPTTIRKGMSVEQPVAELVARIKKSYLPAGTLGTVTGNSGGSEVRFS